MYFSFENGLDESRYVFLENNQLAEKFAALEQSQTFYIFETGFGSGLNFLNCWNLWNQIQQQSSSDATQPELEDASDKIRATATGKKLHFVSVEKLPLKPEDLQLCLEKWPGLADLSLLLLNNYPALIPGLHRIALGEDVILDLYFGELSEALDALRHHPTESGQQYQALKINCWFLDGFAPAKNPEMWSEKLFDAMRIMSAENSSFATFTAAGVVKRQLMQQGFTVRKVAGFGQKREMLCGELADKKLHAVQRKNQTPWYSFQSAGQQTAVDKHSTKIAVIGAGIAGAQTAWHLAKAGFAVDVFEKNNSPAQLGSGNSQGVLYAKISGHDSIQNRFVWQSHLMAERHYRQLFRQQILQQQHGELCGVIQLGWSAAEEKRFSDLSRLPDDHRYWQVINQHQASEIAGLRLEHPAVFMCDAGWLNPSLTVQTLLQYSMEHHHTQLLLDTEVTTIKRKGLKWQLLNKKKIELGLYDAVIVCNAQAAQQFEQCQHLPLQFIRGQTNVLACTPITKDLKVALCHKGYLPPAYQGTHCFGSSFKINDLDTGLRDSETFHNLATLSEFLPDQEPLKETLPGRAAIRVNTPDYMPIIGPVADKHEFLSTYQGIQKDASLTINQESPNLPGFFVNIAHGSRGLASSVLAARFLTQILSGEHPELESRMVQALSANRFLINQLKRS